VIHRLLWPEQEGPKTYLGMKPYRKSLPVESNGAFEALMHLVIQPVRMPRADWHTGLDVAWRLNRRPLTAQPNSPEGRGRPAQEGR